MEGVASAREEYSGHKGSTGVHMVGYRAPVILLRGAIFPGIFTQTWVCMCGVHVCNPRGGVPNLKVFGGRYTNVVKGNQLVSWVRTYLHSREEAKYNTASREQVSDVPSRFLSTHPLASVLSWLFTFPPPKLKKMEVQPLCACGNREPCWFAFDKGACHLRACRV